MEAKRPEHVPPKISREDFELGRMKHSSYSIEGLGAAIVDHLSRTPDEFTPRQVAALERYKYDGSWSFSNPENMRDVRKFFGIFNDVFFNGLLTGYCQLEFFNDTRERLDGPAGGYCMPYFPGDVRDPRFRAELPTCLLAIRWDIDDGDGRRWRTPGSRIQEYFNVLAHEMLHAVFDIYTCKCDNRCNEKFNFAQKHIPWGSHHLSWQAASYALKYFTRMKTRNAIGLNIDLKRQSFMASAIRDGAPLPSDTDLNNMGLDPIRLQNDINNKIYSKEIRLRQETRRNFVLNKAGCIRSSWTVDSLDFTSHRTQFLTDMFIT